MSHLHIEPGMETLEYTSGFGSHVETEALKGALPIGQNSPQKVNFGLYAEQLSGTAFTAPRVKNQRSWLYRIRPRVVHEAFEDASFQIGGGVVSDIDGSFVASPRQMRWSPPEMSEGVQRDFVEGLEAVCGAGNSSLKEGTCIYNYMFNKDMKTATGGRAMVNADGDFLIVPQQGELAVWTELGKLHVKPCEILVIPRGIAFSINWHDNQSAAASNGGAAFARGYVCELFKGHFELPNLGPIGANGLANPRDFLCPVAAYEDLDGDGVSVELLQKFHGKLFSAKMAHSLFDVVAWHGNYYPYKYDLNRFMTINTVSFDHPDPSIFTVLTAPTDEPGVAALDFVIFPPRWMVAEDTFRPPYFHRNCMSEYMGMIYGKYDNKAAGFYPGGASLHPCMSAHGPDATTFEKASEAALNPEHFGGGLAFMFESSYLFKVAPGALTSPTYQADYQHCWQGIKKIFDPAQAAK